MTNTELARKISELRDKATKGFRAQLMRGDRPPRKLWITSIRFTDYLETWCNETLAQINDRK